MEKTLESQGEKLELDEDGYLRDIDHWDVRIAEDFAKMEGIEELTAEHWKLITAIRFHYERVKESPLCRDILIESVQNRICSDCFRLRDTGPLINWQDYQNL
jgi:TusE/DsrC/DsvC family sulfur relay protein